MIKKIKKQQFIEMLNNHLCNSKEVNEELLKEINKTLLKLEKTNGSCVDLFCSTCVLLKSPNCTEFKISNCDITNKNYSIEEMEIWKRNIKKMKKWIKTVDRE